VNVIKLLPMGALLLAVGQSIGSVNDCPQCPYFPEEGASSHRGDRYPCSRTASLDALFDLDERCLFEDSKMLREVATRETQGLEQISELHSACFMKKAEDPQASPLVDEFVKSLCRVGFRVVDGV
jgi:hypothetical protein